MDAGLTAGPLKQRFSRSSMEICQQCAVNSTVM